MNNKIIDKKWDHFDFGNKDRQNIQGIDKVKRITYQELDESNVHEEEKDYIRGRYVDVARKCLKLLFKHKKFAAITAICALGAGGCRTGFLFLVNSGIIKAVNDTNGARIEIFVFIIGMLCSIFGVFYLQYKSQVFSQELLKAMQLDILDRAFKALFQKSHHELNIEEKINIRLVMRADVRAVRNVSMGLINAFLQGITIISAYVVIFATNWIIGLLILAILCLTFIINRKQNRQINLLAIKFRRHLLEHVGIFSSVLRILNLPFGIQNPDSCRGAFKEVVGERLSIRLEIVRAKAKAVMILGFGGMIGILVIIIMFFMMQNIPGEFNRELSNNTLITCIIAFFMMLGPLGSLVSIEKRIVEFMPLARNHFNKAEEWNSFKDYKSDIKALKGPINELKFINIITPLEKPKLLTPITFNLTTGNIYGFIARKAPMFRVMHQMICQIINPEDGKILINNDDIHFFSKSSVIQALSHLEKNPIILPTSIEKNIFPEFLPNDDQMDMMLKKRNRIIDALKLDKAFSVLPNGIKTNLRSRNISLSTQGKMLIQCARILMANSLIYLIELNALDELPNDVRYFFLEEILKRKRDAIIIIKPSAIEHLKICDRLLFFKGFDFVFNASYQDLESGEQHHFFDINPDKRVCRLPSFSENPEDWPTFERAVFGYNVFKESLSDQYVNVIADGDERFKDDSDFDLQLTEDDEMEDLDIELM